MICKPWTGRIFGIFVPIAIRWSFNVNRAYRIGQTKNVTVYRLLGAGSLEELIYACQVYKQQQMLIGYDASIQTRYGLMFILRCPPFLKRTFSRYFEGVKNNRSKQGELFGIKNIFKLDEQKLATKKAVSPFPLYLLLLILLWLVRLKKPTKHRLIGHFPISAAMGRGYRIQRTRMFVLTVWIEIFGTQKSFVEYGWAE